MEVQEYDLVSELIQPNKEFLEMTNKIIEQNNEILKMNSFILNKLGSPLLYMPNKDDDSELK